MKLLARTMRRKKIAEIESTAGAFTAMGRSRHAPLSPKTPQVRRLRPATLCSAPKITYKESNAIARI